MYISGGPSSGVKKSTRCEKFSDAEDFAINWYKERLIEKREFKQRGANTFAAYAEKFQDQQKRLIRRGELDPDMLYEDDLRLKRDLLPYLGNKFIKQVDYNLIDNFLDELHNDRNLAQSTLKKYVILVRKVLKEAEREGVINYIPTLPVVKRVDNPRPWFKPDEYKRLLDACRDLRDNPPADTDFDWGELYDFIVFMIHSFLRPSEWKFLQNKHIRFIHDDGIEQLVISVPNPKTIKATGTIDSTTTEVAADIYRKRILKRNDDPNSYLFFDYLKNRETTVPNTISRKFRYLCEHARLDRDAYGQKHTTYSLRHSALCFQILKTGGNDLFGLAKNARTSVMMLEKFYLTHLSPQMPEFTKQLRTKRVLEKD
ncbi:MAG: phage integrase SAM-like domain-containing protein [Alphaproteobacteria bacterium]